MQWLYSLPRPLLVALLILGGVVLIVMSSPPTDVCSVQRETYQKKHEGFLFPNSNQRFKSKIVYEENLENCRQSNSPGGCYSLFQNIERLLISFRSVHSECRQSISIMKEVRSALIAAYSLFIEISWGTGPTNESVSNFLDWLSYNDVALYCKVKRRIVEFYGASVLEQLNREMNKKIAEDHSFEDFQRFSILVEDCYTYPQ